MRTTGTWVLGACLLVAACAAEPGGTAGAGSSTSSPSATAATRVPRAPGRALSCSDAGLGAGPGRDSGPRLTTSASVVAATICRGGGSADATPAQARALGAALALPQPPKQRVACADHILGDQPTWVLRLSDGRVRTPAAPLDSCGRAIPEVQQAVSAIMAGTGVR